MDHLSVSTKHLLIGNVADVLGLPLTLNTKWYTPPILSIYSPGNADAIYFIISINIQTQIWCKH